MKQDIIIKRGKDMLSHDKLEKEAMKRYSNKLKKELEKESPNPLEISFLQGVIKRIKDGKLFN